VLLTAAQLVHHDGIRKSFILLLLHSMSVGLQCCWQTLQDTTLHRSQKKQKGPMQQALCWPTISQLLMTRLLATFPAYFLVVASSHQYSLTKRCSFTKIKSWGTFFLPLLLVSLSGSVGHGVVPEKRCKDGRSWRQRFPSSHSNLSVVSDLQCPFVS
jgi:hypothetical protein